MKTFGDRKKDCNFCRDESYIVGFWANPVLHTLQSIHPLCPHNKANIFHKMRNEDLETCSNLFYIHRILCQQSVYISLSFDGLVDMEYISYRRQKMDLVRKSAVFCTFHI